jgi:amino acid adenylation domain-containing protein
MDMSDSIDQNFKLPPTQQAIREKCFHPSGTFVEFPVEDLETSIPERFEKIVQMHPDRIAIKTETCSVTYAQLNNASNKVARSLLSRFGHTRTPVVLLLDNDVPMIVGILGVLKAAKIYVVPDLSSPQAMVASIVADTGAKIIVTNNKYLEYAVTLAQNKIGVFNNDVIDSNSSDENLSISQSPEDTIAIFYTSGSTGDPKGVVYNHRNVLFNILQITNSFRLCVDDHISLLASFSASVTTVDIFRALLNGATLCVYDIKRDGIVPLADWLIQHKITIYRSAVTTFRQLTKNLTERHEFPDLRLIAIGGERICSEDIESYKRHFPRAVLRIGMGMTEACASPAWMFLDQNAFTNSEIVPVGYPDDHMQISILDNEGRALQPGEVGEIAVKSRYLAQGYWNRPELTKGKFLEDPLDPSFRIYLTGDLGRRVADGALLYLGRKDLQIKVRGHKVQIPEVEKALTALDTLDQAVVLITDSTKGRERLIAYVVPAGRRVPSTSELRKCLSETFPEYMIPSVFVILDSLPITSTGKIDRRALPEVTNERPGLDTHYSAPKTKIESALARIWGELLFVDQVGAHDNFFDLGGNSLVASLVISRVIQTFNLELPIKALFLSPTVAEMAAIITQKQGERASDEELAQMLREVETLREEEVQNQLAGESKRRPSRDRDE